jgi:hypothetical protein
VYYIIIDTEYCGRLKACIECDRFIIFAKFIQIIHFLVCQYCRFLQFNIVIYCLKHMALVKVFHCIICDLEIVHETQ